MVSLHLLFSRFSQFWNRLSWHNFDSGPNWDIDNDNNISVNSILRIISPRWWSFQVIGFKHWCVFVNMIKVLSACSARETGVIVLLSNTALFTINDVGLYKKCIKLKHSVNFLQKSVKRLIWNNATCEDYHYLDQFSF